MALKNGIRRLCILCTGLIGFASIAMSMDTSSSSSAGTQGGASAIWIFANLSFTGMRAQAKGSTFWKVVSFIFGFPGTLLTLLVVTAGNERAYGIDMPRKP
jgi:hypothetical protein